MHKGKSVKNYMYIHIPMGSILGDFLFLFLKFSTAMLYYFYN